MTVMAFRHLSAWLLVALLSVLGIEAQNTEYDYIVVGSGAGGGPLACRLAMAGFSTLLIESGNDQSGPNPDSSLWILDQTQLRKICGTDASLWGWGCCR